MKFLVFVTFFLLITSCDNSFSPPAKEDNLDFEIMDGFVPKGWDTFGDSDDYIQSIDKDIFKSGSRSASIEFKGQNTGFKAWSYTIPVKHQGKKITLRGYLKTEDVSDGWAGLWMRIDPDISFDNMKNKGITGTTDWQQYEITLDLKSAGAKNIVVGGLLVGKGKMWVDNLELLIDGSPIENAPIKAPYMANKDREFDTGSNITISTLDEATLNDLVLMGKVWGFLKYYHPAIASGKYNWDYELFRVIPNFLASKNKQERDKFLLQWINELGLIEPCTECKETGINAFLTPDLTWVYESSLTKELQEKLNYIYSNRSQSGHYYIGAMPSGNPQFKNEKAYNKMHYPDDGFRLLAIYRYWNIIQYFSPYKHLIDKSWDDVMKEYIPKFLSAKNELEYELTALKLIGEIKDTHAYLRGGSNQIKQLKGQYYPPVYAQIIEHKLVVTDFYTSDPSENKKMSKKIGLNVGDIITSIDSVDINMLIQEKLELYPASNYSTQLRNIAPDLLRSNKKSLTIEFIRDGVSKTKHLPLYKRHKLDVFR